jgi:hypothetical protein
VIKIVSWYSYQSERPGELAGSDGGCDIYRVKVTCRVHMKWFWLRPGQPDVLVFEKYYAQWIAWKQFLLCPDGAVTDLGVYDVIGAGSLKPDSKRDQSRPGTAPTPGSPPPPPPPPPPPIWQPPRGIPEDPYSSGYVYDPADGITYLETRSHFWELVSRSRSDCWITAVYAESTHITRVTLPAGKPTSERWERGTGRMTVMYEIPGCRDGKVTLPAGGSWQPPNAYYVPTSATSTDVGGVHYLISHDEYWQRVDQPPMTIEHCIATVHYQLYYRESKTNLDNPSAKPEVAIKPADPATYKAVRFRVPGCNEELAFLIPTDRGDERALRAETRSHELAFAAAAASFPDRVFDLLKARAVLSDGLHAIDRKLCELGREDGITRPAGGQPPPAPRG